MKIDWTNKALIESAVLSSACFSDVCRTLQISPHGRNFDTIKRWINVHNITTNHFDPNRNRISRGIERRYSSDVVLCENSIVSQKALRATVIRSKVLPYVCDECHLEDNWNGKPITLQLDHKNGIRNDNRVVNLRWLCPNCHSQTVTYCGKNNRGVAKLAKGI